MRCLLVALGLGWGCAAPDSSGLYGVARRDEPGSESSSSGAAPVNGSAGTGTTRSDEEFLPPNLGGVQPTGISPGGGVQPSSAPDAAAPLPEPEAPAQQPGVPTGETPNQALPDAGPAELPPPQPQPLCAGTLLQGSCWYLGNVSQACDDVCSIHGGFSPPSAALIGTPGQGGSIEACTAILDALGALPGVVTEGYRDDDLGLGCHLYVEATGTQAAWWLTSPDLSPQSSSPQTRQVCGCVR